MLLPVGAARARRPVFVVEIVGLDVLHDGLRDEVADGHVAAAEEADLGGGDVVLDELLDDPNVVFPRLEGREGFVDVCTRSLWDTLVDVLVDFGVEDLS